MPCLRSSNKSIRTLAASATACRYVLNNFGGFDGVDSCINVNAFVLSETIRDSRAYGAPVGRVVLAVYRKFIRIEVIMHTSLTSTGPYPYPYHTIPNLL